MKKTSGSSMSQKLHYGGFDAQWPAFSHPNKMRRPSHRERADSHRLSRDEAGILLLPDHYATKEAALPIWNVIEFFFCFAGANEFLFLQFAPSQTSHQICPSAGKSSESTPLSNIKGGTNY